MPDLYTGELAYDEIKGKLYIGESDNGLVNPKEIGGSGWLVPSVTGISPLRDGRGANGTWNIDISGNAQTVTSGVYRSYTLTAGSGLQGGGNFSINRSFHIGQGKRKHFLNDVAYLGNIALINVIAIQLNEDHFALSGFPLQILNES